MRKLLTVLAIFSSVCASAFDRSEGSSRVFSSKNMSLKAGGGFHYGVLDVVGDKAKYKGISLSPQVGQRIGRGPFEISVISLIRFSKKENVSLPLNEQTLAGRSGAYDVLISPQFKTYIPWGITSKGTPWNFYFTAGPSWSLHSFTFKNNTTARDLDFPVSSAQFKVTYDTYGLVAGVGFQEVTKFKSMHPVFIELLYTRSKTRKASLLDTSKFHVTNVVFEERQRSITYQGFVLQMGITLF
jgi:hypothetical protein